MSRVQNGNPTHFFMRRNHDGTKSWTGCGKIVDHDAATTDADQVSCGLKGCATKADEALERRESWPKW